MTRTLLLAFIFVSCGFRSSKENRLHVGTPEASSTAQPCLMGSGALRSGGSGIFSLGNEADRILSQCSNAVDTVEFDAEGNLQRVLVVNDTVGEIKIEISHGQAWRLSITTPRATTEEGIGVGRPWATLLELPELIGVEGEGQLFVTSSAHCGLSFGLDHYPGPEEHRGFWTRNDLEQLPASTTIREVVVFECAEA